MSEDERAAASEGEGNEDVIVYPMSYAQERLWFLHQLDPSSSAYNIAQAYRVRGALDVEALERAFATLVERHDSLRTTFGVVDGEGVQIVAPPRARAFRLRREAGAIDEGRRRIAAQAGRPFDLARDELLRVLVIAAAPDDHLLALTIHHIVSDGWSMAIVMSELATLYEAYATRRDPTLDDPELQYPDFAVWQREWLSAGELDRQIAFWKDKLEGVPVLELPTDGRRRVEAGPARRALLSIEGGEASSVRAFTRSAGATLTMVALAAYGLVLSRHAGQSELAVGLPIANRTRAETEGILGLFVNTLAVRLTIDGASSFATLVDTLRSQLLEAYQHQDLPFERLVAELNPERDLTRNPIFQVLLNVVNLTPKEIATGGLTLEPEDAGEAEAKLDLDLYVTEGEAAIHLALVFNGDLFAEDRMTELLAQVKKALLDGAAKPQRALREISLVTGAAATRLPDVRVAIPRSHHTSLAEMFTGAALTHARLIAVKQGASAKKSASTWTYEELARASLRIAAGIASRGVAPGDTVSVTGPRSFGLVATMLAAFRGGFVLLTLDPALPPARAAAITEVARAKLAVVVAERAPEPSNALHVDLDGTCETGGAHERLIERPAPDAPAYLFFTSGTTGAPKGVLGRQSGLAHFLAWERAAFEIGPGDVVGQLTGLSFDVVLRDVFVALVSGATLALPGADEDLGADVILPWLASAGVTILHTVPSLAAAWLADSHAKPESLKNTSLRRVLFAGEPLTDTLVRAFRAEFPAASVGNLYGPTETTLAKCFFEVPREPLPGIQPVGTPLPDTQALVLSKEGALCGIGEMGEIVIRTPFQSLGYLGASPEEQARFSPNPCRDDPDDVLYRTGDLGRYAPSGDVQILGRVDHQVKVRGVRIEPAEVSAVLATHDAVASAVVVARGELGEVFLVAYYVLERDARVSEDELREHLAARLLPQMVPDLFERLAEMPLGPNGKIDRARLPVVARSVEARVVVAPRDALEETIAGIWREVLGARAVSVEDNFFRIGGHSLMAARVLARLRASLRVELTVRDMFEAPTIAAIAARVRDRTSRASVDLQVPRVTVLGRPMPLSFAQERMWFLTRLAPKSWAYHVPVCLRICGALDADALGRALDAFVARHPMLRTRFVEVDGEPRQIIEEPRASAIPPLPTDAGAIHDVVSALFREPFSLEEGHLVRARLLRAKPDEHFLAVVFHHIVFDGWSMGIFQSELATLYEAFSTNRAPSLPLLPITYADFASWQRASIERQGKGQLAYWKEQLAGAPSLALPTDHARPALAGANRGGALTFTLEGDFVRSLRAVCVEHDVTTFMALLATFAAILGRYGGQEDVSIGTPVANRGHADLEGAVGFFVNTLVMRVDLAGDPTFAELLRRTKEIALNAYANQDVPFERVVEHVNPHRDTSRTPLYQAEIVLHNTPQTVATNSALTIEPAAFEAREAKFDVSLALQERGEVITAHLEYNADLFEHAAIEQLAHHWRLLSTALLTRPETRIGAVSLLSGEERMQALTRGEQNRYAETDGVHHIFGRAAQRHPSRVAARAFGRDVTYQELAAYARAVTDALLAQGTRRDDVIGVSAERGTAMLAAVLGVLGAGAAVAPIDPAYPSGRAAQFVEEGGLTTVLTTRATDANMRALGVRTLVVDELVFDADAPVRSAGVVVTAENLAYIIFTSGSTGRPKGVAMNHGALANLVVFQTETHPPRDAPRALQFFSMSFDVSFQELFTTWRYGGAVILVDEDTRRDARSLVRWIIDERVDQLFMPFVALQQVAEEVASSPGTQRLEVLEVIATGEQLRTTPALVAMFRAHPKMRLYNHYGPSETHNITEFSLPVDPTTWEALPSIGSPIANNVAYVLDRYLDPVPLGVVGELYLGGAALARGYIRRSDLTAERFVPNPFVPGARLYRSGDLAILKKSGAIGYLGRADHQVKVRGFRVELGEIEAVLAHHPLVAEIAIVARGDSAVTKRLVAFVVAKDPAFDRRTLIDFARERLPEFMVPTQVVLLERLPLTPSGKISRLRLMTEPLPQEERDLIVRPGDAVEEAVAAIWSEVLQASDIGIDDDFFALGGHSLLATRVLGRVRAVLSVEVPVLSFFNGPTVRQLAAFVRSGGMGLARQLPPFVRKERESGADPSPAALSFSQQRFFVLHRLAPSSPVYNVARALRLLGDLDVDALTGALTELVRRHESLRTTYRMMPDAPKAFVGAPFTVTLTREVVASSELVHAITREVRAPFDISADRLLRARLLEVSPPAPGDAKPERVLVFVTHHIAVDGWSLQILAQELVVLYEAFAAGRTSPLEAPRATYVDYAEWQQAWLRGTELDRQLAYWKKELAGVPPLALPTDFPRPPFATFAGDGCPIAFDSATCRAMNQLTREEGATTFMALLAAFSTLLSFYSGQDDFAIGTPIASRVVPEVESVVGVFVNSLAIRVHTDLDTTFAELLRSVRTVTLGAYGHQDAPFESVVEAIGPERDPSRTALFQAALMLEAGIDGRAHADHDASTLRFEPLDGDTGTTKYELSMQLFEVSDGIVGSLNWRSDLFERTTMERMARRLEWLVLAACSTPNATLRDLLPRIDGDASVASVRQRPPRLTGSVFDVFAARALAHPGRDAVRHEGHVLSYAELFERSRTIASHLLARGLGLGEPVGLFFERSCEMIAAQLGVLAAGGAFVPLDTTAPLQRTETALRELDARFVLGNVERPRLDDRFAYIDVRAIEDVAPRALPKVPAGSLAYVIFTSGSTGTPKGCAIEHGGMLNLHRVLAADVYAPFGEGLVASMNAPYYFDASIAQLVLLLSGHTLAVVPQDVRFDVAKFWEWARANDVTLLDATPSHLRVLLENATPADLPALRAVFVGGEPIDPVLWADLGERSLSAFNAYGPTECSVIATARPIESGVMPLLGTAIQGAELHVLDKNLRRIPQGLPGELFIGGLGVGRGYFRRPELTAARFVPSPFGDGERLYATGDLVRERPSGDIEYLGRIDHQVKLRGFRIELTEIESTLRRAPGVRDVAVTIMKDLSPEGRIVAHVVGGPDANALRTLAEATLPGYMVPSAFVHLERLPLTPNGKVDLRALPAPEAASLAFVAPTNATERAVADAFARVLELERVSLHDGFFRLGGTSLGALRLIADLHRTLGEVLPMASVFKDDSVEAIARVLAMSASSDEARERLRQFLVIGMQPHGARTPFFCVHAHSGEVLVYSELAKRLAPDQPFHALRAPGLSGERAPLESIEAFARVYLDAIRTVQPKGPYVIGGYSAGAPIAFKMAALLRREDEGATVIMIDAAAPIASSQSREDARTVRTWARNARERIAANIPITLEELGRSDPSYLVEWLVEWKELEADAPLGPLDVAALEVFAGVSHALSEMAFEAIDARVVFLRGLRSPADLAEAKLAWRALCREMDLIDVDTDHAGIVHGESAEILAGVIRREIDRATER